MKIDRSNYEIWLVDWLDGNLNRQDAEMLRQFLNENPDIKAEAEDLQICTLLSTGDPFRNKELLKRSPAGISDDQFEYLSIASFENDLSEAEQYELEEIISNDPARREIFEHIGKLKLDPGKVVYTQKNRLFRRTPVLKGIRITLVIASAAAVIALLISLYLFLPERIPYEKTNSAQLVPAREIPKAPEQKRTAPDDPQKEIFPEDKKNINRTTEYLKPVTDEKPAAEVMEDNIAVVTMASENTIPEVKTIVLHPDFELSSMPSGNRLVACNFPSVITEEEEDRSSIGRFIARNFREKLLREETPPDTPLKGFEIAAAGVAGINKIFGWEMELDEKKTEAGETKSVYFSSRIIKFNAPVKRAEPLASSAE